MKQLRRYLVAGILVWAPLFVTFLLLRFAVNLMDKTLAILPPQYRPDELLGFHIPGLGVILTFIVLFITGMLAANFVGRYVVGGWESLLNRIPIVRTIYGLEQAETELEAIEAGIDLPSAKPFAEPVAASRSNNTTLSVIRPVA